MTYESDMEKALVDARGELDHLDNARKDALRQVAEVEQQNARLAAELMTARDAHLKTMRELDDALARATRAESERDAFRLARAEDAETVRKAIEDRAAVERELDRVQGLPELEWAQAAAVIVQGLALHARTDQPAAKRMLEALDKAKTYVGNLKARAERAEADNAGLLLALEGVTGGAPVPWDKSRHPGAALLQEMEALRADSAALLGAIQDARDPHSSGNCDTRTCRCGLLETMDKDHPGAALLERLRTLEGVLSVALEMDAGDACTANWARLHEACAAVDALKERKP